VVPADFKQEFKGKIRMKVPVHELTADELGIADQRLFVTFSRK